MSVSAVANASSYPADLSGKYECESIEVGTNQLYTGKMIMTKTGQTYSTKSIYNDGSTYSGIAIYNPATHRLSSAFINPKNAEETGVAMVEVEKNYMMHSTWTYLNKTTVGHGTCKKVG